MLGEPLDIRIVMSRTKADWKMVRGDVDYHDLGNQWILLRFANVADRNLVWDERPWHVQGELLVLLPWRPFFDPFSEEIEKVDLWIRIPRFPTELLNSQSVANLVEMNKIGKFIRLDQRSLLRNKIRFARACITVNILEPLKTYAEIVRQGGKKFGYLIWFEDFSKGCAFCGDDSHPIESCPLLHAPPKEVKIVLEKAPSFSSMAGEKPTHCTRPESHPTTAQSAYVVHAKPRQRGKAPLHAEGSVKNKNVQVPPPPPPSAREVGPLKDTVMQQPDHQDTEVGWISVPASAKGKRSLRVASSNAPKSPSNDESHGVLPQVLIPSSLCQHPEGVMCMPDAAPPNLIFCGKESSSNLQLAIPGNSSEFIEDELDRLEKEMWNNDPDKGPILLENSNNSTSHSNLNVSPFLSLNSDDSFLKQIEGLEVEQPGNSSTSIPSDVSKRKGKESDEADSASTSLKRARK